MRLVLIGPPGAGKGTHAEILSADYKVAHLATGDILRQQIREKTALGQKAKDIIEGGNLLSDELINEMMFDVIRKLGSTGFILDGFPRTLGQAEAFESFLKKEGMQLDAVLDFATSEDMIIRRLSGRRVCEKCGTGYHLHNPKIKPKVEGICDKCGGKLIQRKDDAPETIQHRLEMYYKETFPLLEFYRKKGLLKDLPGDEDVTELQEIIKALFKKLRLTK